MAQRTNRRGRVLLAKLDPIVRLGLVQGLAAEGGIDVLGEEQTDDAIIRTASMSMPDVIVIDGDSEGTPALSERLRDVAPDAKLILLPREEARSTILDPPADRPRRVALPVIEALRSELNQSRPTTEE